MNVDSATLSRQRKHSKQMSGYLSQMIKAESKEREFSESFIVAQRPRNTLHIQAHQRRSSRQLFPGFHSFVFLLLPAALKLEFCKHDKELRSAYTVRLYKLDPRPPLVVAVCVCFQSSSVSEKLRFEGMDRIQSDLFLRKHISGKSGLYVD